VGVVFFRQSISTIRLLSLIEHFVYQGELMADQDLYSGLMRLHVLYHASAGPIFGLGMIRELRHHGYRVGPGTLYPMLHRMQQKGYLRSAQKPVEGRIRRVYGITARGRAEIVAATAKVRELYNEMIKGEGEPSSAHPRTTGKSPASSQLKTHGASRSRRLGGGEGRSQRT
jgi:PadR family transcriptional regulator PadR